MLDSLTTIDGTLIQTSKELGATFSKNNTKGMWLPKDFEERSISWSDQQLNYLVQIFPTIENDEIKGWNLLDCSAPGQKQKKILEARQNR